MDAQERPGVALTSFDRRTAGAVVTVLNRAGIEAWTGPDEGGDTEVRVPDGTRDAALRELGARMEEVRVAAEEGDGGPVRRRRARRRADDRDVDDDQPRHTDPDDVHAGPPLVMERFRSMRFLAAVVIVPGMVVSLAWTLRGEVAVVVLLLLAALGVAAVLWRRR